MRRLELLTLIGCALVLLSVGGLALYAAGYSAGAREAEDVCYCARR